MCYNTYTYLHNTIYWGIPGNLQGIDNFEAYPKISMLQGLKHGHATVEEMKAALKLEMGNKGMAGMARCFWILAYSINISQ